MYRKLALSIEVFETHATIINSGEEDIYIEVIPPKPKIKRIPIIHIERGKFLIMEESLDLDKISIRISASQNQSPEKTSED